MAGRSNAGLDRRSVCRCVDTMVDQVRRYYASDTHSNAAYARADEGAVEQTGFKRPGS